MADQVLNEFANEQTNSLPSKKRTKDIQLNENVTFDEMLLPKPILDGLKSAGFLKPSPIQYKAIPLGRLGLDLIVQAKAGTGKTGVFTVIALEHLLLSKSKAPQVIVLAPTREVALQISDVIKSIGVHCKQFAKCETFIGGQSLKEDKAHLKSCQIAVGTPGRILHLITENLLNVSSVRLFILDEADKLLAPEFQESINLLFSKLPDNKQIITLSATYPSYMASYVIRYMRSPTYVRLNVIDPSLRGIKKFYKITPYSKVPNQIFDNKVEFLLKILQSIHFEQCIIFINYQLRAENLCHTLNKNGWQALFISGNIEQSKRNYVISQLKDFKCRILVSTDLISRGIDLQNVDLVINMDLPQEDETYLHRIGRAGRFGCEGIAISFVDERDELNQLENIIEIYNLKINQFNESLSENMLDTNDQDEQKRIDDVTIKKVELTKEQLDDSLIEYEQIKNSRRYTHNVSTFKKIDTSSKKSINNGTGNYLTLTPIDEIYNTFKKFKIDNKENNLDDLQNNFIKKVQENLSSLNLSLDKIYNTRKNILGKYDLIYEKIDGIDKSASHAELVNFNDLYKWEEVKKESIIEQEIHDDYETFENFDSNIEIDEEALEIENFNDSGDNDSETDQEPYSCLSQENENIYQDYSNYYSRYFRYYFQNYLTNQSKS